MVVAAGGHLGHGLQGPAEPACAGFVDTDADKPSDKYLDSIFSILVPGKRPARENFEKTDFISLDRRDKMRQEFCFCCQIIVIGHETAQLLYLSRVPQL